MGHFTHVNETYSINPMECGWEGEAINNVKISRDGIYHQKKSLKVDL